MLLLLACCCWLLLLLPAAAAGCCCWLLAAVAGLLMLLLAAAGCYCWLLSAGAGLLTQYNVLKTVAVRPPSDAGEKRARKTRFALVWASQRRAALTPPRPSQKAAVSRSSPMSWTPITATGGATVADGRRPRGRLRNRRRACSARRAAAPRLEACAPATWSSPRCNAGRSNGRRSRPSWPRRSWGWSAILLASHARGTARRGVVPRTGGSRRAASLRRALGGRAARLRRALASGGGRRPSASKGAAR